MQRNAEFSLHLWKRPCSIFKDRRPARVRVLACIRQQKVLLPVKALFQSMLHPPQYFTEGNAFFEMQLDRNHTGKDPERMLQFAKLTAVADTADANFRFATQSPQKDLPGCQQERVHGTATSNCGDFKRIQRFSRERTRGA